MRPGGPGPCGDFDVITGRASRSLLIVLLSAVGALSACSSSSSKASSSTTTLAPCGAATELKSSVEQLKNVDIAQNGTSSLQSAVDNITTDLHSLGASVKAEFKPQVEALQSALTSFVDSVKNVVKNGTAPVHAAAKSVQTAAQSLEDTINTKC